MITSNCAEIRYFGKLVRVICDRQCGKAWGINSRPTVQLSDDEDDTAYLADNELGEAPVNPGTYEGGQGKPPSPDLFPNKWCVRECERCTMADLDEPLELHDFSTRRYNQPWKHQGEHTN